MNQDFYQELLNIISKEQIQIEEPMRNHTTFRVGGPAEFFVQPKTAQEVQGLVKLCKEKEVPYYIVGNGSNLLVSDKGYRGVIIQIFKEMNQIQIEGELVKAQAGALLSGHCQQGSGSRAAGFEFAAGIPGALGGACVMNAGAYGGEMKDVLREVTVLSQKARFWPFRMRSWN